MTFKNIPSKCCAFCALALSFWLLQGSKKPPELALTFSNIQQAQGSIYIALYDNEAAFLNPEKMRDKRVVAIRNTGNLNISFPNLAEGDYAISCFHDLNDNGKLDTNVFGVPSEPFGFSNNARPNFRAPNWAEAMFQHRNSQRPAAILLKTW